jgi:hypothetical protein
VKCKFLNHTHKPKYPVELDISRVLTRFQKPLSDTSDPKPQLLSSDYVLGQTHLAPDLGSNNHSQTCPTPSPDMSDLSALSRVMSQGLDISGPQAGFQRWLLNMSDPRPRHVWISDTTTSRFPWGAIKGPNASLAPEATN